MQAIQILIAFAATVYAQSTQCSTDAAPVMTGSVYSACGISLTNPSPFTKDQNNCLCSTANQAIYAKAVASCTTPDDKSTLDSIASLQKACQQIKSASIASAAPVALVAVAVAALAL
ncbi:hypothetical protein BCR33DRAFT_855048 [Rhizoclosmatium globosum]|uniref:Extracellular membrane protein CFEM domain-containing protein n=1 Tax=Rhizoclosmatium globosum TaxID=329046 RepID=A0A1Y2BQ76_9FUNG|nr:hypothetical protein BCR33DRAFT_855048 [Rhizoclosmatium globosum]|eukprot:ORY36901.1 hypothetical protein BCR33DRAFT_855048 [Rhizoclosmatium globosum]